MGDDTKQLIKYGAIAVAAYFVYEWLVSSGLWAQWFGGSTTTPANQFTSPSALLTYCQANPTGTAIYVDSATGVTSTASCAQWIASNSASPLSSTSVPGATSTAAAAASLPTNMQQALAAMKASNGSDSATIDVWDYYYQNNPSFAGAPTGYGVPNSISPTVSQTMQGYNGNNPSSPISGEQYLAWLQQAGGATASGVSGLMDANDAYAWVN